MTETLTPDICVIGAGSGGLTVAGEMSSDQLAEAQKRAREWKPQS